MITSFPWNSADQNAVENLWPQRRARSYEKDRTEDALQREVCAGHLQLTVAQKAIARSWVDARQVATDARATAVAAAEAARQAEAKRQADIAAYVAAVAEAQRQEAERQAAIRTYLAAVAQAQQQQSRCDPNYTGCVPIASDVDCAGGSGNGPAYTGFVRVIGRDIYDLDADGDGLACE